MATTAVVAGGGGGATTTVVVAGSVANVKYCGIKTHVIAWFFPCIACCPIDERRADEEVYIGIQTWLWCLCCDPCVLCFPIDLRPAAQVQPTVVVAGIQKMER